ncbi:MAG: hypothetical protein L0K86_04940 [Actinomycetia bacterium]|nr:hypothetical protein [Actinomycetes bacterium]
MVDDPVDAAVIRQLSPGGLAVGAAVAHRDEEIEDGLLEESGLSRVKPGEKLCGDLGADPLDALIDLFGGIERFDLFDGLCNCRAAVLRDRR